MPIPSAVAGATSEPLRCCCDARWLMAYAAGIGRTEAVYLDAARPGGVVAHPVFPVAPEWALRTDPQRFVDLGLDPAEGARSTHAGHRTVLHQPLRQDTEVELRATVVGVEPTRAGARVTTRFDADHLDGTPAWTSLLVSVYRGVDVDGPPVVPPERPVAPDADGDGVWPLEVREVHLGADAAHVYTECARIWNPIHTDPRAARAAGLPGPILHGTATLAHGVSAVLDIVRAGPEAVHQVAGAFSAMVTVPTRLVTEAHRITPDPEGGTTVRFVVRDDAGTAVVRDGRVVLRSS